MPQTELIIFDCDGVLADSEVISAQVMIEELETFGITVSPGYVYRNFVGKSFPVVASILRQTFDAALPRDFEDRYRSSLIAAYEIRLQPTPGLGRMLDSLGLPACIATSSSPPRVARTLDLLGLAARFAGRVFTASQVAHGKPAPDLFLLAARRMGVAPPHCLVIEDSLSGIAAGIAAGMPVWRYAGGAHLKDDTLLRSQTPPGVPVFDNWDSFYLMAPEFRAPRRTDGEAAE